ncbi:MAG: cupredoxin domain-containing protein [Candidatus Vogelbacteria bacterium]
MKATVISIIFTALLIGGAVALSKGGSLSDPTLPANNVRIVDGKQIIEIRAKGGYLPRRSVAQAGLPTTLRFDTNGTFDCSSSVRIPSLNISKILPQSGTTDIDIGSPPVATLYGTCGMGMYPFEVDFQS